MTLEWQMIDRKNMSYYYLKIRGAIMMYSTRKGNALFARKFKPLLQKQVHGQCINNVDEVIPEIGDGLISTHRNAYLGIRVADCLPVFLFDQEKICAIHCGWRGIAHGIADAAKALMTNYHYALGASIGPCCCEISTEVEQAFAAQAGAVIQKRNGKSFLDLKAAVMNILGRDKLIADLAMCTKCRNDLFYSYRAGDTEQRNYAVICKE